jgi:hypothetical protein
MTKLIELLRNLERERFYGNVQIEFQAGDIALVRKTQTFKLDNTRPNNDITRTK